MHRLARHSKTDELSPPMRDRVAVALRAVPVLVALSLVAMLVTGVLGSGSGAGDDGATMRIDAGNGAAGPTGTAAEKSGKVTAARVDYERGRPRLFVEGTIGPFADTDGDTTLSTTGGSSVTAAADSSGDSTVADTSKTTATGLGGSTETTRRSGSTSAAAEAAPNIAAAPAKATGTAGATTTTTARRASTTNPTAGRSTTTRRSTTAAPTTRQSTTAAPTTAAPTTAAPTTAAPATFGNSCASNAEFERIFRDDFSGSSVSGSWAQFNSNGNANHGLRRSSANTVANGKLTITAKMENGTLVSGGMSHGVDQKYGKWVVKVRTDNDPSQAVSGVVLTWPQSGVHPRDGENNIYETLVQSPNRSPFFTFIHKPYGSKSDQEYKEHHADGSQFQVMTMEWTPSRITIIREGPGGSSYRDVWTVNETSADLIPDVAHHLAIQLDAWKHSIANPVRMEVDYVEVYKYCG